MKGGKKSTHVARFEDGGRARKPHTVGGLWEVGTARPLAASRHAGGGLCPMTAVGAWVLPTSSGRSQRRPEPSTVEPLEGQESRAGEGWDRIQTWQSRSL